MPDANREALVRGFLRRNAKQQSGSKRRPPRITEDDPRWNPATMGNKRWGSGYRGALNYKRGSSRPG